MCKAISRYSHHYPTLALHLELDDLIPLYVSANSISDFLYHRRALTLLSFPLIPPIMVVSPPHSAPCSSALHPGCQTHVSPLPGLPLPLERHKRLLWCYQQPLWPTSISWSLPQPTPPSNTAHYITVCLHLICSQSTKLLSANRFSHTSMH